MMYFPIFLTMLLGHDSPLATDPDQTRIVGGHPTTIDHYPYQVSLRFNNRHVCGGAIISEEWIITAAHCVQGAFTRFITIKAGASNLNEKGSVLKAQEIIVHDDYNRHTSNNDVALIRLEKPLEFNSRIQPIGLASSENVYSSGSRATVTGWGVLRSQGSLTNQLRKVEVPLVSDDKCNKLYSGRVIASTMVCAGYVDVGGKDACQGDSGGPLVQHGTLIGIVSWGFGCADKSYPGVYSRVTAFRSWIKQETGV